MTAALQTPTPLSVPKSGVTGKLDLGWIDFGVLPDTTTYIVDAVDPTKRLGFDVSAAMVAGKTLRIVTGAQTLDRNLTVPVLTADATLMVLSETQTVTKPLTIALGTVTGAESNLVLIATWNDAADQFRALDINVTDTASAATAKLLDCRIGGSSRFNVEKSGLVSMVGGINLTGTVQATLGPGLKITSTPAGYTGSGLELGFNGTRGVITCFNRTGAVYLGYDFNALDITFQISGSTKLSLAATTGDAVFSSTTNATSVAAAAIVAAGGIAVTKNIVGAMGLGVGTTRTATAAGTTTLTATSTNTQVFTGTTTQTCQLPAANLFGASVGQRFTIKNISTGLVTVQRAGADTINYTSNVTSFTIPSFGSIEIVSNGVSEWDVV